MGAFLLIFWQAWQMMSHLKLLQTQSCPIMQLFALLHFYHPNRIITWLSLVPFYHLKNFIAHVNFKLRHSVQIFTVCVNGLIYFTQEIHNCFLEILSSDEYSKKREFLETQNVILASGNSLLVSRNSIHSSFDSRVETVNLLLSGTEILHSQGHNVRSDLKVHNHYKV